MNLNLSFYEKKVMRLREGLVDGHKYTFEEIGRIFKITRGRVHQVYSKALRKTKWQKREDIINTKESEEIL